MPEQVRSKSTASGDTDDGGSGGFGRSHIVPYLYGAIAYLAVSSLVYFLLERNAGHTEGVAVDAFDILELTATVVFAAGGAVAAAVTLQPDSSPGRRLVLISLAAFLTANGGGTIRDVLSLEWPFWLQHPEYAIIPALISSFAGIATIQASPQIVLAFRVCDHFATGIFASLGVMKAADLVSPDKPGFMLMALLVGTLTAIGGGVFRDCLILRKVPYALASTYGMCAVMGSLVHAILILTEALPKLGFDFIPEWLISSVVVLILAEATAQARPFAALRNERDLAAAN